MDVTSLKLGSSNSSEHFKSCATRSPNSPRSAYSHSKWSLLRNVVKAVRLLRVQDVASHEDVNLLIKEIQQIPSDNIYRTRRRKEKEASAFSIAVKDHRREMRLFQCVERGHPEDLEEIKIHVDEDPYRHIRSPTHPQSFVNKPGSNGQTPLYVAAKHGNFTIVNYLVEAGADPRLPSIVEDRELETPLEVASRWGHYKVVEYLLGQFNWPKSIIKRCLKISHNKQTRNELQAKLGRSVNKKKCFCV
jgi:hypothetical protein